MDNYSALIRSLRVEPFEVVSAGLAENMNKAADAIQNLQAKVEKQRKTILRLAAEPDWLCKRVKLLESKLCDWCAVCPKERRKPEDCELLTETPVMYGPSDGNFYTSTEWATVRQPMDRITLVEATKQPMVWAVVYAAEPNRRIAVEMTYADLWGIAKAKTQDMQE